MAGKDPWHGSSQLLTCAGLPSIPTILMKAQLRWAGHVARMPDSRIPKKLLFGELQTGKRSLGAPKKRYKDTRKVSLKTFGINPNTWEKEAANRTKWRTLVHGGARQHEADKIITAQRRRQDRKEKVLKPQTEETRLLWNSSLILLSSHLTSGILKQKKISWIRLMLNCVRNIWFWPLRCKLYNPTDT